MQVDVPGVHTMDIQKTGRVPQLPAGVAGWAYGYRRNWNLFFLLSSCGWCDPGVCVAHSWLALALLDMRNVLAAPHSSYPMLPKPGTSVLLLNLFPPSQLLWGMLWQRFLPALPAFQQVKCLAGQVCVTGCSMSLSPWHCCQHQCGQHWGCCAALSLLA